MLVVYTDEEKNTNVLTQRINATLQWLQQNIEQMKRYSLEHLLDLKNESWLEEDEKPMTEDEFTAQLVLSKVAVELDGSLELILKCGHIFWGHEIIITTDEKYELQDIDIIG